MVDPSSKVIVITGSTRGIGYGLAASFLDLGCHVVVSGRFQESTDAAVVALAESRAPERILGRPCDVRDHDAVQQLWDGAMRRFERVDIWINNAGVGTAQRPGWAHSPEEMAAVVQTNVLGTLYGARVALQGMLAQGFGALYNMEGLGSDGRRVRGLSLYGATKRAVRYFTEGLVAETRGSPVLVGSLSPGMVTTDLLVERLDREAEDWEQSRWIINILADRVETVAPWLARKVLENTEHGAQIKWLTPFKVAWRFLSAPFTRRDVLTPLGE
ncbi:MAG: SDR family NAD(P)-dependent oxidoreductase [Anaerolineae bacterium]